MVTPSPLDPNLNEWRLFLLPGAPPVLPPEWCSPSPPPPLFLLLLPPRLARDLRLAEDAWERSAAISSPRGGGPLGPRPAELLRLQRDSESTVSELAGMYRAAMGAEQRQRCGMARLPRWAVLLGATLVAVLPMLVLLCATRRILLVLPMCAPNVLPACDQPCTPGHSP